MELWHFNSPEELVLSRVKPHDTSHSQETIQFCHGVNLAACGMSSGFSPAGWKHTAGTSQSSEHVLVLQMDSTLLTSQHRSESVWLKEGQRKMVNSPVQLSFLLFAAIVQISNSQQWQWGEKKIILALKTGICLHTGHHFCLSGPSKMKAAAVWIDLVCTSCCAPSEWPAPCG